MKKEDRIRSFQAEEEWKSSMSHVISGCHILRIRCLDHHYNPTSKEYIFRFEASNLIATWRLQKTRLELLAFSEELDRVFPVEAALKGSGERTLPTSPKSLKTTSRWMTTKRAVKLQFQIADYLQEVLDLPPYQSRSRLVLEFLLPALSCEGPNLSSCTATSPPTVPIGVEDDSDRKSQPSFDNYRCIHSGDVFNVANTTSEERSIPNSSELNNVIHRVKVMHGSEIIAVKYSHDAGYEDFLLACRYKLDPEMKFSSFKYQSSEEELITVMDKEDLNIAVHMQGYKLVLVAV